jgi:hypothetical protein
VAAVVSIIGKVCGPVGSGVDVVVVLAEPQAERMPNKTTAKEPASIIRIFLFITQE